MCKKIIVLALSQGSDLTRGTLIRVKDSQVTSSHNFITLILWGDPGNSIKGGPEFFLVVNIFHRGT